MSDKLQILKYNLSQRIAEKERAIETGKTFKLANLNLEIGQLKNRISILEQVKD